ncbi:MAG: MoxR family ATPase [Saprospiraceae bacterium]|jgi:MoxR-like ATPase
MAVTTIWTGSDRYLCDAELAQAFHMSRVLGMPLLIEGEPGTGKTELPIQFAKEQQLPLFIYPVGSKSTVEQFVAKFDHVKYLRDSQIEVLNAQRLEKGLEPLKSGGRSTEVLDDYVILGPGAKAYSHPNSVLLIDEIDKAPREFPNDLLFALSHRKFILPESGKEISVSEDDMPAIVITSNREQELPTAFKGRCIYHYISFPEPDMMEQILNKHFPEVDEELVDKSISLFYQLRNLGLERAPSTRELLNWLKYLQSFSKSEALAKIDGKEGMGVLIKTQTDMEKAKRLIGKHSYL